MPRYPLPATQPYTGTLVDNSPIVTNAMLPFIGQLGPHAAATIEASHGRRLAGFGDATAPFSGNPNDAVWAQLEASRIAARYVRPGVPGKRPAYVDIFFNGQKGTAAQVAPALAMIKASLGRGLVVIVTPVGSGGVREVFILQPNDPFIAQLQKAAPNVTSPNSWWFLQPKGSQFLTGFGATEMKKKPHYVMPPSALPIDSSPMDLTDEPDWTDSGLSEMEKSDDVVGSGVFDKQGRVTVNPEMGVFSTNPSVPGFIHRNPPYRLNTEVRDVVTGGPTVEVSGGGLFYIEREGRPAPIPTARTGGGYVFYNPDGSTVAPLPEVPSVTVDPNFKRVAQVPTTPSRPPSSKLIRAISTVNVANVAEPIGPSKLAGFGDDKPAEEAGGWGKWLAAGLLVGVAGGVAWNVYAKKR